MALVDLRGRADEPAVRSLLEPEPDWILIGWDDGGELVACAGVERAGDDVVLRSLVVRPDRRRRGIGRSLVDAIAGVATARRLVADRGLDDGFLRRCGFSAAGDRYVRPIEPRSDPTTTVTLDELSAAIEAAWGRDTSDDPDDWSEENRARGQCAVTAMLVRELIGGEIVTANVVRDGRRVDRHAWNRLPSGLELDLTRSQFRNGERFEAPSTAVPLLAEGEKAELLAARVRERLGL